MWSNSAFQTVNSGRACTISTSDNRDVTFPGYQSHRILDYHYMCHYLCWEQKKDNTDLTCLGGAVVVHDATEMYILLGSIIKTMKRNANKMSCKWARHQKTQEQMAQ